jgi:hypothetical protein
MAPADNERRRRAAAKLFSIARPTVAARLARIEAYAADCLELLDAKRPGIDIAEMRRETANMLSVCAAVLAEPAPDSLVRLNERLLQVKHRPRSGIRNREKYYAAAQFVAENPGASVYQIMRAIGYEQRRIVRQWLADPEFKDAVEVRRPGK